ncbi:acyl transferase/acyl hydrolase/lysophospholipase [Aspergillus pseudodeflectus]|uniref:Acyl transferase/acyl hydrolase/lysophospholipase n=1 Tax=Aspergillus pseudodeflectus TaxID=176178 RepID=A0ABR4KV17_9EURO
MASVQDCGPLRPVRLLSLDGGGIRGISELTILAEIMHRVKVEQQLDVVPLPAGYFDMICGTSTGGLIAILLGRLRFSVAEAIEQYGVFAEKVFSSRKIKGQDGSFKASRLEEVIKEVICKKLGEGHEEEKMYESEAGESECKTFVCAASAKSLKSSPRLFRTWMSNINPSENCTIWEACRATTAAPTFFKSIRIGRPGVQEEFVDAGLGCNNPVKQLLLEACQEFGKDRPVSCIVSIGTGKARVIRLNKPRGLDRWIHRDLVGALAKMATDSEEVAREMERRFEDRKGPYFRLNVDQGLEDITMEDWEKLGEVATHTKNYIVDNGSARAAVERIVAALVGKPLEMYQLGQLGN